MNKKILLVAGGSGGHLFPALSIINSLKKFNTVLLTDHRAERYVRNTNINYKRIITARLKFNFFFILNLLKLILSIFQNLIIITKHKPDLVIGFGGYTSIPSLIAAKLLRKKIIIHEQNAVMGKTNRLLSKFADVVATSFTYTKYAPSSAVHTGIPLRKKGKIRKIYSTKKRIFVVGGSQGAAIFSKIVPSSLEYLSKSLIKKIVIVQQARIEDIKLLKNFYSNLGIKHEVKSFFEDIYFQYYNSDLVISRCGASTLAEIEFFSKNLYYFHCRLQ